MSGARARPSLRAQLAVKSLLVYRNGDPFFAGRRVVVREKGCSFDALLREAMCVAFSAPSRPPHARTHPEG